MKFIKILLLLNASNAAYATNAQVQTREDKKQNKRDQRYKLKQARIAQKNKNREKKKIIKNDSMLFSTFEETPINSTNTDG